VKGYSFYHNPATKGIFNDKGYLFDNQLFSYSIIQLFGYSPLKTVKIIANN